jgi:hypothetical protein
MMCKKMMIIVGVYVCWDLRRICKKIHNHSFFQFLNIVWLVLQGELFNVIKVAMVLLLESR